MRGGADLGRRILHQQPIEVVNGLLEALVEGDFGFPVEFLARQRNIGLSLDRIVGRARPENPASCRVLEKIGMRPAGEVEREGVTWLRYEIGREDWHRRSRGVW